METETYGLSGMRKNLSKFIERYLIKFVDLIFVVSDLIADEYVKMYHIKRPSVILNCPHFLKTKTSNYFREKYKINNNTRLFIYQGAMSEGRGIRLILKAFSMMENSDENAVVFLGYGALEPSIIEYTRKFSNIFFHEAVSPGELMDYTCSADIGLSLIEGACKSYNFCLPNKVFQYTMAGLPVIVSNLAEMREYVCKNDVGWVLSPYKAHMLKILIESIKNKDISRFKKNAKITAKIYNWENQERKMIGAYGNVLR